MFNYCLIHYSHSLGFVSTATKCRCLYACPDGQINGTCFLKEGGYCFTNVRTFDNSNGRIDQEVVYGCFPPDVEGLLQVC